MVQLIGYNEDWRTFDNWLDNIKDGQVVSIGFNSLLAFIQSITEPDFDGFWQATSGSTGPPKNIFLTKDLILASAEASITAFRIDSDSCLWLCIPLQYIGGKMLVMRAILSSSKLAYTEPSLGVFNTQNNWLNNIATFVSVTPLQIEKASLESMLTFKSLKTMLVGGSSLSVAGTEKLDQLNVHAFQSFGMTETASHIALKRINGKAKASTYSLLPNTDIEVNSIGCLEVKRLHGLTMRVVTNDIIKLNEQGDAFTFLGRADNVINSGGLKVNPELVEPAIASIIAKFYNGIKPFIVTSVPDKTFGERVILVIDTKEVLKDTSDLISEIKAVLGAAAPKTVIYLSIPKTATDKLDRQKLKSLLANTTY